MSTQTPTTIHSCFPPKFVWGVATSAAQIEGAAVADGKGPSIWDHCATYLRGAIANNDSPTVACDHYYRWAEDIRLMNDLGIRNYRFSIAWPRIIPDASGKVNHPGLDFYERLVDGLLDAGIRPWITLFHWDLPQWLEERGGWCNPATAHAFGSYAAVIVRTLGDRVKHWMTMNELPCFIGDGYERGTKAPFRRESRGVVLQAYHYALLAHGLGVQAVREYGRSDAQVGMVHNPVASLPLTESSADIAAARLHYKLTTEHLLCPLFKGRYPDAVLESNDAKVLRATTDDLEIISEPTDFLGLNIYFGHFVRASDDVQPEVLPVPADFPRGGFSWLPVTPSSPYWAIRFTHELYSPQSIYITENGVNCADEPDAGGQINDIGRIAFFQGYLAAALRATSEGYPLKGFFAWSLMDNFEWADGYAPRMGLVHVDYRSQRRTPKLSAFWYSNLIRANNLGANPSIHTNARSTPAVVPEFPAT